MRCTLFLSILIQVSAICCGQEYKISGFVTDSESGQKLCYASIMVINHALGISSDTNGFFELSLPDSLKNDTLVVSYVGYISRKICISSFKSDTIDLVPQTFSLSEIVIKPSTKKSKLIFINRFNKSDCSVKYTLDPFDGRGNQWLPYRAMEPSIESIYFPYNPDYNSVKKIKEIWVYLNNFRNPPTFCRLRILSSTESLTPDQDLLAEPVDLTVNESSQLLKINVEKYSLTLPKQGIFVGIELLIIPENAREFQNNLGDVTTIFSPFLSYIPTTEPKYKFWLYTSGRWIQQCQSIPEYTKNMKNLFYKPAITLVLDD